MFPQISQYSIYIVNRNAVLLKISLRHHIIIELINKKHFKYSFCNSLQLQLYKEILIGSIIRRLKDTTQIPTFNECNSVSRNM